MEKRGMEISREKTKYLHADGGMYKIKVSNCIRLTELPKVTLLKYLVSTVQENDRRIKAGWYEWKKDTGVLCN